MCGGKRTIKVFKFQTKLNKILAFLKSNKTKLFLSSKKGTNLISSGPKITGTWEFVNIIKVFYFKVNYHKWLLFIYIYISLLLCS